MTARYALYFTPAQDTPVWSLGCAWLGRDPATGQVLGRPQVDGFSAERLRELTAFPRLYGLHATLKPPFRLRPGSTSEELADAVRSLAARHASFQLPRLAVGLLAGFLALRTVADSPRLRALADAGVTELDEFRLPPDDAELQRRRAVGLTWRQEELLLRYGYPYVLDEWRFHITLTERLATADAERLRPWLAEHLRTALDQPLRCEDVCLFVQPLTGADFRLLQRFPLNRD
jgi:putative phosphonate metabolism protein